MFTNISNSLKFLKRAPLLIYCLATYLSSMFSAIKSKFERATLCQKLFLAQWEIWKIFHASKVAQKIRRRVTLSMKKWFTFILMISTEKCFHSFAKHLGMSSKLSASKRDIFRLWSLPMKRDDGRFVGSESENLPQLKKSNFCSRNHINAIQILVATLFIDQNQYGNAIFVSVG